MSGLRILIVGAGYGNKGAEAMLRTATAELGSRLSDAAFCLWHPGPAEVALARSDGLIPIVHDGEQRRDDPLANMALVRRARRLLLKRSRLLRARAERGETAACQALVEALNADPGLFHAVVDISGYAYGDAWGQMGYKRISPLIEHCRTTGKPVFFLPQAWGPFDTEDGRRAIVRLLGSGRIRYYSRDGESSRHLASALGSAALPAEPIPDIAFVFAGDPIDEGRALLRSLGCPFERPLVGIAPNMRIYQRVGGQGESNEYVKVLAGLGAHCLSHWGVDLVLLPNEIGQGGGEDDRFLCSLISGVIAQPDRCFTPDAYLSAGTVWSLAGCLDFLAGSRFHALVFALSQGVPAMAIGWSHKYDELFSLFGWKNEVAQHDSLNLEKLAATADAVWRDREQRHQHLLETLPVIRDGVHGLFDEVAADLMRDENA